MRTLKMWIDSILGGLLLMLFCYLSLIAASILEPKPEKRIDISYAYCIPGAEFCTTSNK